MSWTKGQIVAKSFSALALAGFQFDISPEAEGDALTSLEPMLAQWDVMGARLGYAMSSDPLKVDPQQESNLPDWAIQAVYSNLALVICGNYGKQAPNSLAAIARSSYDTVLAKCLSTPPERQYPSTMPRGAGNRWGRAYYPFMPPPTDPLEAGPDAPLEYS